METSKNDTGVSRKNRKTRTGIVVSSKGDKSIVVSISRTMRHPLYSKVVTRSSKLYAHDEKNEANLGDEVEVMETRPVSKMKCWRLVQIVKRAQ